MYIQIDFQVDIPEWCDVGGGVEGIMPRNSRVGRVAYAAGGKKNPFATELQTREIKEIPYVGWSEAESNQGAQASCGVCTVAQS